jgi:hypothetical protein
MDDRDRARIGTKGGPGKLYHTSSLEIVVKRNKFGQISMQIQ